MYIYLLVDGQMPYLFLLPFQHLVGTQLTGNCLPWELHLTNSNREETSAEDDDICCPSIGETSYCTTSSLEVGFTPTQITVYIFSKGL